MASRIRVLGIDPGSRATGWGALDCVDGGVEAVEWGVVAPAANQAFDRRILAISQGISEIVRRLEPAQVAVEDLFYAHSVASAIKLGQVRGAVVVTLGEAGLPLRAYPPASVKKAVSGFGAAGKGQVARMVQRLLGLDRPPEPADAADALAVALCHIHTEGLATAGAGSSGDRRYRHPVRG